MEPFDILAHRFGGGTIPGRTELVQQRAQVLLRIPQDPRDHVGVSVLKVLPAAETADIDAAQAEAVVGTTFSTNA